VVFFIEALKASKLAADEVIRELPKENHLVMLYNLKVLNGAGYKTDALLAGLSADEKAQLSAFRLPDADDRAPDRNLPRRMDMLWADFFATGRFEPVQKIVSFLGWHDDYDALVARRNANPGKPPALNESAMRGIVYVTAGWSLNALSHTNPLLEDYLAALEAAPDTPANIKNELSGLHSNPRFIRK